MASTNEALKFKRNTWILCCLNWIWPLGRKGLCAYDVRHMHIIFRNPPLFENPATVTPRYQTKRTCTKRHVYAWMSNYWKKLVCTMIVNCYWLHYLSVRKPVNGGKWHMTNVFFVCCCGLGKMKQRMRQSSINTRHVIMTWEAGTSRL